MSLNRPLLLTNKGLCVVCHKLFDLCVYIQYNVCISRGRGHTLCVPSNSPELYKTFILEVSCLANKGDRGRTFELTLYLDTPDWHDILSKIINVSDSAYVVHDRDIASAEDVEAWAKRYPDLPCPFIEGEMKIEHIHAIVRFPNARYLSAVQVEFGLKSIRKCSSLRGYLRYLVHIDYEDKYQYDKSDVKTFGRMTESFKKALEDEKPFETRVIQLCELLDSYHRFVSKRDFVNICCEADLFGTLVQMKGWAFAILEEHNSEYIDGVKFSM